MPCIMQLQALIISLMQSEIWCYKFRIAFSRSISGIISNKILLISAKGSGEAL